MGKQARAKREAREARAMGRDVDDQTNERSFPIWWIIGAFAIVAILVAGVATSQAPDSKDQLAWSEEVTVDGEALPGYPKEGTNDPAEGIRIPLIGAKQFNGDAIAISADERAKVVIFLAHWCPHCQAEVPRIVDWAKENGLPKNVDLYAVATATDKAQPNFPPHSWLKEENWPTPVLVDDKDGNAANAYGLTGLPFIVFVDADGNVVRRYSGEMPIDEFDAEISDLEGAKS